MTLSATVPPEDIYIPICFYFNISAKYFIAKISLFTFQYVSILILFALIATESSVGFTFQYVSILISTQNHPHCRLTVFTFQYVSILINKQLAEIVTEYLFTFQYVSILIHRPNSRFFSTLFPHFLLTSQSLQIFYHISFINSTKEKQNHLFFMFVEFCRCTGIFTLSEGDSLKIVGTE